MTSKFNIVNVKNQAQLKLPIFDKIVQLQYKEFCIINLNSQITAICRVSILAPDLSSFG